LHNLRFYLWLVENARLHIEKGDFYEWKNKMTIHLSQRL
jgi:queuine tRNA-ribosyltransferase